jgi:hypothetical protein
VSRASFHLVDRDIPPDSHVLVHPLWFPPPHQAYSRQVMKVDNVAHLKSPHIELRRSVYHHGGCAAIPADSIIAGCSLDVVEMFDTVGTGGDPDDAKEAVEGCAWSKLEARLGGGVRSVHSLLIVVKCWVPIIQLAGVVVMAATEGQYIIRQ